MTNDMQQQPAIEPSGKWTDMRTGDTATVKTMVNDSGSGGAQVMFTDGTVIPFSEFSAYYIQQEDYDSPSEEACPRNLNVSLLTAGMGQAPAAAPPASAPAGQAKKHALIYELLDGLQERPRFGVFTATIENVPYDAISAVVKYFGVSADSVADAIVDKFVSTDEIVIAVKNMIKNDIKKNI